MLALTTKMANSKTKKNNNNKSSKSISPKIILSLSNSKHIKKKKNQ